MAESPANVQMEAMDELEPGPIPEKCLSIINEVACHQMNISDAYFSMACYYNEEKEMPSFAVFIQDQAEVKWFQARQTIKYIAGRNSKICVPDIQRPVLDNWGQSIQGLTSVLEMENELTKVLENLRTAASEAGDNNLLRFVEEYLIKQKRNEDYLAREIANQKQAEKQAQEESVFKKPAMVPHKMTNNGSKTHFPVVEGSKV